MSDPVDANLGYLQTQLALTRVLAEGSSLAAALPGILEAVSRTSGWEWAALWVVEPGAATLRCENLWHLPDVSLPEFEKATRQTRLPRGIGLPGRVWASGQPAWIVDVTDDDNFPRAAIARKEGLHGAFAFPVVRGGHVLAVMEFFARHVRPPDERLLALMAVTGEQLGHFMHRRHTEEALLASEARNVAVLETALDCIVSMNHLGIVAEWNPAAQRTFGYTREQAIGKEMAELIIPPALRERHRAGLARYLKTGEGPVIGRRIEIVGLRAGGAEFPVELAITPVPGSNPPVFTGYLRDISDRKRAEEERARLLAAERDARREAESANLIKDEFLATVSHELRTPLTAILGWTQLLRADAPAHAREALETIERNGRAMTQLVDDVLDVSRIIQGKLRLDVRPIDLPGVIEAALASIRPAAAARGIDLQPIINPFAGHVYGDPGRLQQIAWNLLSNAIKFTPKGGKVQVRLERINSHVELTVSDSGQGIDAEFLPHIFQRFRQADSSTGRAHTGLGLGLAIARHLAELHGGSITVKSAGKGTGATFIVCLPIAAHADTSPQRVHSSAPVTAPVTTTDAGADSALAGVRLLVVDDDPDTRRLLAALLGRHGAVVHTVAGAAEALASLAEFQPHVLLSDIGMSGTDGYELIRQIRALAPDQGGRVPAVALTAFARPQDRRAALAAGFQMHLAKPIEPAELMTVLANLANRGGI